MSTNFSEQELDFIENALSTRQDLELSEERVDDNKGKSHVKPVIRKTVQSSTPGYKKTSHWIAALFILPFLLVGVFYLFLLNAQSFLGGKGTLDWLANSHYGNEIADTAAKSGFTWLPTFLEIYAYRWPIIIGCFAVCFAFVGILMVRDAAKNNKADNLKTGDNDDNETE